MSQRKHSAVGLVVLLSVLLLQGTAILLADAEMLYSYEEFQADGSRRTNGPTRWADIKGSNGQPLYPQCGSTVPNQSPVDVAARLASADTTEESDALRALKVMGPSSSSDGLSGPMHGFTLSNDGNQMWLMPTASSSSTPAPPTDGSAAAPDATSSSSTAGTAWDPVSLETFTFSKAFFRFTSEHVFGGSHRDFEVQLEFTSSSSSSPSSAAAGGTAADNTQAGPQTLMIVVTMEATHYGANTALDHFWHLLPSYDSSSSSAATATAPAATSFDFRTLFPVNRDYVVYDGALSFPPCTPGVRYVVFRSPSFISEAQIQHFRNKMGWTSSSFNALDGFPFGNYRPIQAHPSRLLHYTELGHAHHATDSSKFSVFYDDAGDEDTDTVKTDRIYAYVSMVLGLLSVILSVFAIYQVIQRAPSDTASNGPGGALTNGGGGGANKAAIMNQKAEGSAAKYTRPGSALKGQADDHADGISEEE